MPPATITSWTLREAMTPTVAIRGTRMDPTSSLSKMICLVFIALACASRLFDMAQAADAPSPTSATLLPNATANATMPMFTQRFPILMPGVMPQTDEAYVCAGTKLPAKEISLVEFEPLLNENVAHHVILFGCGELPTRELKSWDCKWMGSICGSDSEKYILYAWGKNAPALEIPAGVGFRVGGDTRIKYLVLQVHYGKALKYAPDHSGIAVRFTRQPLPFSAGMFVMYSNSLAIPPASVVVDTSATCTHTGGPLNPMAFRVHAHTLAKNISCERERDGVIDVLGWRDPSHAQAFLPIVGKDPIQKGDKLTARCTFDSNGRNVTTIAGSNSMDEMCNCYIMYYTESHSRCDVAQQPNPDGSIPPIPTWCIPDEKGNVAGSDEGTYLCGGGSVQQAGIWEPTVVVQESDCTQLPPCNEGWVEYIMRNGMSCCKEEYIPSHPEAPSHDDSEGFWNDSPNPIDAGFGFSAIPSWLETDRIALGQVSALTVDAQDRLWVFHRGPRVFDEMSFLPDNTLADKTPIVRDTVLCFDARSGALITSWGGGEFYMPHGISVDKRGAVWTVDCGAHVVRRYSSKGQLLIELGTLHVPGKSDRHFCKPTAAVASLDGLYVYVADGYCNARVMKFTINGKKVAEWGEYGFRLGNALPGPGFFNIPHSIALDSIGRVYVADRQNSRVQRFSRDGVFERFYALLRWGTVYAVAIAHDTLYVVNGPERSERVETTAIQLDFADASMDGRVLGYFGGKPSESDDPRWPSHPHDVSVSRDGMAVFVADIDSDYAFKFVRDAKGSGGAGWLTRPDAAGGGDAEHEASCSMRPSLWDIVPQGFSVDTFFDECPCPIHVDSSLFDTCITGVFCHAAWATDALVEAGVVDPNERIVNADGSVGLSPVFVAPRLYQDVHVLWMTYDSLTRKWLIQHVPSSKNLVSSVMGRIAMVHAAPGDPAFPPTYFSGSSGSATVEGNSSCIVAPPRVSTAPATVSVPPNTPANVPGVVAGVTATLSPLQTSKPAILPTVVHGVQTTSSSYSFASPYATITGDSRVTPLMSRGTAAALATASLCVIALVVGGVLFALIRRRKLRTKGVRYDRVGGIEMTETSTDDASTASLLAGELTGDGRGGEKHNSSNNKATRDRSRYSYRPLQALDEEEGERSCSEHEDDDEAEDVLFDAR
eukprot:Opistho-2@46917